MSSDCRAGGRKRLALALLAACFALALAAAPGSVRAFVRPPGAGADTSGLEAGSAAEPLAEGRRVVERAVRVAGGMEAYRAIEALRFRMVTEDYRGGQAVAAESSLVMFRKAGGLYREESRGTVVGFDGRRGWALREGRLSSTEQDSVIGAFLGSTTPFWMELPFRFLDGSHQMRYAGSVGLDPEMPVELRLKLTSDHDHPAPAPSAGTRFYDMVFVSPADSANQLDEYFAFFDRKSGRFRGCNFTVKAAGMKTPQWCSWFDDYQSAGGVEFPRRQTWFRLATDNLPDMSEDHSGILRVYRKLYLEPNPVLPDSLFAPSGR